ncbi:hypothetical protein TY91_12265 [Secundilactobacillus collinoides]|uniref:Glycosyltransferase GT-D fold domain-containing protein n=1 Tax=Secundilactobacillus collinoides TaxID=33960 RepID=A0A166GBB7_SECCO|nr:hypothetical protein TY91_12265 [Secundilactobacillus collinoides]
MLFKNIKKSKQVQLLIRLAKAPFFFPYLYIVHFKFHFNIHSPLETSHILLHGNSISRFGDGEFNIALRRKSIGFQPYSDGLRNDLYQVLLCKNVCIAIPHSFKSTKPDKFLVKTFWWMYVTLHYKEIKAFVNKTNEHTFLDASFSRTVTELKNKNDISNVIKNVRNLWSSKHIIMIEGAETRFGVGNDLFSQAIDVSRILAPVKDAYSKSDAIIKSVNQLLISKKNLTGWANKNVIILIALGPTASILVKQLNSICQCIDIGHFDLQYEYLKQGYYHSVPVTDRYDNEISGGSSVIDSNDSTYHSEIISNLSII